MYTIRVFKGDDACYVDTTVTVKAAPIKPTLVQQASSPLCRSNGTAYTIKFTATGGTVTTVPSFPVTGDSIANIPIGTASVKLIITSAGGCKDSVTAPNCLIPCIKPDAGKDSTYACVNSQLPTGFDLKDAAAGQKWKIISPVPAGASISVTTPSGLVSGTIVAGTYRFLLQTQSDSLNCRDTVQIVVQLCTPPPGPITLRAKAYLQGALYGVFLPDTLMRDDLRKKGYLPTASPYPDMGMTGITTANTSSAAVVDSTSPAGKDAIVDWVFIELRSDTTVVADSRSALIQRDGDIVGMDGVSPPVFNVATPGNYFIVVKHRNHLSVMTKNKIALGTNSPLIDFRKVGTTTYNLNPSNPINISQVSVQQGHALWAGNVLYTDLSDNKRSVTFQGSDNDVNPIYLQVINAPANTLVTPIFKLKGYFTGDVTMNGEVIYQGATNDVDFIYQNVINHPGNSSNLPIFKIKEQLK